MGLCNTHRQNNKSCLPRYSNQNNKTECSFIWPFNVALMKMTKITKIQEYGRVNLLEKWYMKTTVIPVFRDMGFNRKYSDRLIDGLTVSQSLVEIISIVFTQYSFYRCKCLCKCSCFFTEICSVKWPDGKISGSDTEGNDYVNEINGNDNRYK